ncbi:MAG: ABC transporter permease subunit [Verrucomicrobia bacterium]|nr:ABC transporter permease subunit [Verrucomicrobiota bacterium]MBI3871175.1 ABC transporter permease subunit [Verrucomicrobiota bacterium]
MHPSRPAPQPFETGPGSSTNPPRRPALWIDLMVVGLLIGLIQTLLILAREWSAPLRPVADIHLETRYLPLYTLFSFARGMMAYVVSFCFTLVYGYAMAKSERAERVMLPVLDILQSIPVLGFLPGLVLTLVRLFPRSNLGLEMASVLMIFTGQVWNMVFSFYASVKSVSPDLTAVARIAKLTRWQTFLRLELSCATPGLLWNSMLSMAGGWFFLTVSESFVLGEHDYRLPGLGSYMAVAIERGDGSAQALGLIAMALMIIALDQLVWRPLVSWSQKFTTEESHPNTDSWLWNHVRRARLTRGFALATAAFAKRFKRPSRPARAATPSRSAGWRWAPTVVAGAIGLAAMAGAFAYFQMIQGLTTSDWSALMSGTGLTFARILAAVAIATLWTVPVGVAIGQRPSLATKLQPWIQMAASFPAPMIFPVALGLVLGAGGTLSGAAVVMLLLSTQWYLLFNIIAGARAIPRELVEASRIARLSRWQRWRRLVMPAIFPQLLTGWITAMGGAWNASIVAEYVKFKGQTLSTHGLGALISQSTERGQFAQLAAAVGFMAAVVVGFNRLVWRPLSHWAQTRFAASA